jgi:hypothetical protein
MPDPAPTPLQVPDFRDRGAYPARPAHHPQSYDTDFRALVAEVSRGEPPEIQPRPFCDPKMSNAEYEKRYRDFRYKLSRQAK